MADILFIVVAPVTAIAGSVKLTHSDGDLPAHIRLGDVILGTGAIPSRSIASFTASQEPFTVQAWLSEVILSVLHSAGGLSLVIAFTAVLVAATHASVALFLRSKGVDARWALAAALMSLAVSSTHWLARPHMFSILGVALTILLLESSSPRRLLYFGLLFAAWANLHAGWLYGLLLIGVYAAGTRIDDSERTGAQLRAFGVALAATLLNPFGIGLHREVIAGAASADLARQMAEFLPPDFLSAASLPFLVALLVSAALLAVSRRKMQWAHLFVVVATTALALRSFRHIALFGVSAWPLIALHSARTWPSHQRGFRLFSHIAAADRSTRAGLYALPMALILLLIGANHGRIGGAQVIRNSFSRAIFPVTAVDSVRSAGLGPDRIFQKWTWGGYIMYAVPGAHLLVDPLKFNQASVDAYSRIDGVRAGWQRELQRWTVRTVIVPPDSPLAQGLEREPGWKLWYSDSTASVFRPVN